MQPIPNHMALVPVKAKHAGGRPSLYSPLHCEVVVELGAKGKSKAQIAAKLGVSRQTLDAWTKVHPEFLVAMKRAKDLEMAWWEEAGQDGILMGKQFNATAFIFQMKNRFRADYLDRVENTHKLDVSQAFLEMHRMVSSGKARELVAA